MIHTLFFTILYTLATSTLYCAESPRPESPRQEKNTKRIFKKKSNRSNSTSSTPTIKPALSSALISPTYNKILFYHPFLKAVLDQSLPEIKFQLDHNPALDVNMQTASGNTALHIATEKNNFLIMNWLLQHYATDATILNNKNQLAYHLIPKNNKTITEEIARETRHILFSSGNIHLATNDICLPYVTSNPKLNPDSKLVHTIIAEIKTKITTIEKEQSGDRQLPPEALFNNFYGDNFLQKKVFYTIDQQKKMLLLQNH